MKQDVFNQVEKVLSSLDQVNRATPSAYFYSRLRSRMETGKYPVQQGFSWQPAFTLLVLLLLLGINVSLLLSQSATQEQKWLEADDQSQWKTEYALQESIPYQENPIEWAVVK